MKIGSVLHDAKRDRTHTVRTEENIAAVQQHFLDDPHTSTRRAAATLQMSRTSANESNSASHERSQVTSVQGADCAETS